MSFIKIFKKSEKGSITLMVLTAMIFLLVVITASYFAISNKSGNQDKKISKIAQQYRASTEDMNQEYTKTLNSVTNLTMEQVRSDGMFDRTINTNVTDDYGNEIVVPAGFKVTEDATNVTEGIVIEDKEGNQFVWIPVGDIKYAGGTTNITLGRYVFDSSGNIDTALSVSNPGDQLKTSSTAAYYHTEGLKDEATSNAHAIDIEKFIRSANGNHGYYIGRYEAGVTSYDSVSTSNSSSLTNWTGYTKNDGSNPQIVCKDGQQVWNYITQNKASELSRNMYDNTSTFTSDLINSYAWDTAIVFIQTFGTESNSSKYSYQIGLSIDTSNPSMTGKGILSSTNKVDEQCNIFDMAGNCSEWTTETSSNFNSICVSRGCSYSNNSSYTSLRWDNGTTDAFSIRTFRPLLYLNN